MAQDSNTTAADNRHAQSVTPVVTKLSPHVSCSLKRHFRGALREVVGYLDLIAKKDSERFVYPKVDSIVAACKKYKQVDEKGKPIKYSRRIVENALEYLRAWWFISGPVFRVRDHVRRKGFIVAPHDAIARRDGATCALAAHWRADSKPTAPATWNTDPETGAVFWAGCAGHCAERCAGHCAEENSNCAEHCADEKPKLCGELCGPLCGTDTVQVSDSPAVAPMADEKCASVCAESAPPILVSRGQSALEAVQSVGTVQVKTGSQGETENPKDNSNSKTNSNPKTGSGASSSLTDFDQNQEPQPQVETIALHFAGAADLDDITDGDFTQNTDYEPDPDLDALVEYCNVIIKEWATRLYLGRKTNGDIMAQAMVRFTTETGTNAPPCWYAIVKALRQSPAQKQFVQEPDNTPPIFTSGTTGASMVAGAMETDKRGSVDRACWTWLLKHVPNHLTKDMLEKWAVGQLPCSAKVPRAFASFCVAVNMKTNAHTWQPKKN